MDINVADCASAEDIARLVVCLTSEIIERTGVTHFHVDLPGTTERCRAFIEDGRYRVIVARENDRIIGFGALCESHSLYAEGSFGIIQEFYVLPEFRCQQIGRQLMNHIISYARDSGWKRLELCTPPIPAFERTLDFYRDNGFEITGGFKMKRLLT